MQYVWKREGDERVSLRDLDPDYHADLKKQQAKPLLEDLGRELDELQELCYVASARAVLIVLQGVDASGKDGTISHVMSHVNPQGCWVTSFKEPTEIEMKHDFLWRMHRVAPAKGMIGIFNRSYYEDVLVVRVHKLQPPAVWRSRFDQINDFERILSETGTIVLKFLLHIGKEEQEERLRAREEDPLKRWKLTPQDLDDERRWDDYQQAYEDVLKRCSTPHAPWHVVPANRKWFRNLAVAHTVVDALRPYRAEWERTIVERGNKMYEQVLAARRRADEATSPPASRSGAPASG